GTMKSTRCSSPARFRWWLSIAILALAAPASASVTLSPAYGDFGVVGVAAKSTQVFTLTNTGNTVVALQDFRLIDPLFCCFQIVNGPVPDLMGNWPRLKPGASLTFSVAFVPQIEGPFSAQVQIDTDDPVTRHLRLPLGGVGASGGLGLAPTWH